MAINEDRFVKGKRFTQEFTLDDPSDQVIPKTAAGTAVGDAIAAAVAGATIADATDTVKGKVALAVEANHPSTSNTEATTPAYVAAAIAAIPPATAENNRTAAYRNALINGDFNINQRNVSGTVTLAAGAYGHDRFKAGAGGCTYTFATVENITTVTITAGSLIQVVEGLNLYSGPYTLSWIGTAQGKIGSGSYATSGVTGTVVGGANLNVEFNTGTLSLTQLEAGSVATEFERRPYGTELALCQRYYEVLTGPRIVTSAKTGLSDYCSWLFKVTKRADPTVTFVASSLSAIDTSGIDGVTIRSLPSTSGVIGSGSNASAEL